MAIQLSDLLDPVKAAEWNRIIKKNSGKSRAQIQQEADDEYYEALGEEIERHPISSPKILRHGH